MQILGLLLLTLFQVNFFLPSTFDIYYIRHYFQPIFLPFDITYPPFGVYYILHYFLSMFFYFSTFCPVQRFLPSFLCPFDVITIQRFVLSMFFYHSTFCFLLQHIAGESSQHLTHSILQG
jgi:hypothetical protein